MAGPMSAAELRLFVQPDETALELAQRARVEAIRSGVPALGALRATQVLELSGPSGSCKTELLMQVPPAPGPPPAGWAGGLTVAAPADSRGAGAARPGGRAEGVSGRGWCACTRQLRPPPALLGRLTRTLRAAHVILLALDAKFDARALCQARLCRWPCRGPWCSAG